jgi:hypothetical protein
MQHCCEHICGDGIVLPNDADFFERINSLVTIDGAFSSVFVPQVDQVHLGAEDRLRLAQQLEDDRRDRAGGGAGGSH